MDYDCRSLVSFMKKVQVDIAIPKFKLALEYQGEQHYRPIYPLGTHFEEQQRKDAEKRRACKQVDSIELDLFLSTTSR